MTYKEILELIKFVSKSDLSEVKVSDENSEVVIRTKDFQRSKDSGHYMPMVAPTMSQAPVQQTQAASVEAPKAEEEKKVEYREIRSPMVGTFYRSASPDKPSYVKPGDQVNAGSVVCIIEAMKLFNEIEADISGTIVKIMVDDASPVEYDQVLFLIE